MTKQKPIFPIGAMIAAFFILANPNISLLDIVPDAIAYVLLLYSLRHVSTFAPYMGEAAEGFRKMLYISLIKVPALFIMLTMAMQRVTITVFSLTFAALELLFLLPAVRNLFEGFFYLGARFGCEAAIRETPRKPDAVLTMTYVFLSAKMAMSTLPEFMFLFEYDQLTGEGFYFTNAQYLFVALVGFTLVLILGLIWLSYIHPYLRAIAADEGLSKLRAPDGTNLADRESTHIRITLPYFLFGAGLCFGVDLVLDYKNVLPDYLAAACFIGALAVMALTLKRATIPAFVSASLYTAATVAFTAFQRSFYRFYSESDLTRIPEADAAYLPVIITSVLSEILFVVTIFLLIRTFKRYRALFFLERELHTEVERRYRLEEQRTERKQGITVFVLACLAAIFSALHTILLQYSSAVEMLPGYGGGALYLPRAGSFWLFGFVLAIALAVYGGSIAAARAKELCAMNDERCGYHSSLD